MPTPTQHPAPDTLAAFALGKLGPCPGGADRSVRLWDVETGKQLARYDGHPA